MAGTLRIRRGSWSRTGEMVSVAGRSWNLPVDARPSDGFGIADSATRAALCRRGLRCGHDSAPLPASDGGTDARRPLGPARMHLPTVPRRARRLGALCAVQHPHRPGASAASSRDFFLPATSATSSRTISQDDFAGRLRRASSQAGCPGFRCPSGAVVRNGCRAWASGPARRRSTVPLTGHCRHSHGTRRRAWHGPYRRGFAGSRCTAR